jgi:hypothetical protein
MCEISTPFLSQQVRPFEVKTTLLDCPQREAYNILLASLFSEDMSLMQSPGGRRFACLLLKLHLSQIRQSPIQAATAVFTAYKTIHPLLQMMLDSNPNGIVLV